MLISIVGVLINSGEKLVIGIVKRRYEVTILALVAGSRVCNHVETPSLSMHPGDHGCRECCIY